MSFKFKLTLLIYGVLLLLVGSLFLIVYDSQETAFKTLVDAISKRCEANASSLGLSMKFELKAGINEDIRAIAREFKKENEDANYIMVYGADKKPIAHVIPSVAADEDDEEVPEGGLVETNTGWAKAKAKEMIEKFEVSDQAQTIIDETEDIVITLNPVKTDDEVTGFTIYAEALSGARSEKLQKLNGTIGLFVLLFLLTGVVLYFIGSKAAMPITNLVSAADQIEQGNLTEGQELVRDPSTGEFGPEGLGFWGRFKETTLLARSFRAMSGTLRGIVKKLADAASRVSIALGTISKTSKDLFDGVQQQSVSATKVFDAIEQVNSSYASIDASLGELNRSADRGASSTAELSQSLQNLSRQIQEMGDFVNKADTAVKEMGGSASQIASNISNMNSAVDGAASSVSQFNRSIQIIENNAEQALDSAKEVSQQAQTGRQDVYSTIKGMDHIFETFILLEAAFAKLSDQIDLIANIIQVINEVGERTKLLAVNTNILAAGAGEHGKAFAVVAREMKELFDRTSGSTREIAEILALLNTEREHTFEAMDLGIQSVRTGQDLAKRAGKSIESILELSEKSHTQMTEIATVTREQVLGSRAIAKATQQISTMGQDIFVVTKAQRGSAEMVNTLVSEMVATIANVQKTIDEEAATSTMVAELVNTVYMQVESIRNASLSVKSSSKSIVSEVGTIRDVAEKSLSTAHSVSESISNLQELVDSLNRNVGQFRVD